jgi:hypothetical protein
MVLGLALFLVTIVLGLSFSGDSSRRDSKGPVGPLLAEDEPGAAPDAGDQARNQIFPLTLACTFLLMKVVI